MPKNKYLHFRCRPELWEEFESHCTANDLNKSEIIESLIKDFLKIYGKGKKNDLWDLL